MAVRSKDGYDFSHSGWESNWWCPLVGCIVRRRSEYESIISACFSDLTLQIIVILFETE
jgi:hypothetical protein